MHKQVLIIGGGISGLTCAYRLQQRGCDVLLVERDETVGGVMKSQYRDGFLTETGPNSFLNAPEIMQLIDDVGLTDDLVTAPASAPRYIYQDGALQEFPMSPPKLLSTSLLSLGGKIRVFLEPFVGRLSRDEESIAEFITRRFGRQVLDSFVDPFVSGVYAGDPARLCVRSTFPQLTDLERDYGSVLKGVIKSRKNASGPRLKRLLCSFKRGLGQLPEALGKHLGDALWTGVSVESLRTSDLSDRPRFTALVGRNEESVMVTADIVVLATPAYIAAGLVKPLSEPLAYVLTAIEYPPLAVVCLAYNKAAIPRPIEGFGFLIPRHQGLQLLGCLWNSSLFPGRAPEGKVCLTNFIGGATNPKVRESSDEELIETTHRELQTTLGVQSQSQIIAVHRYHRAIAQYNLGHQAKLKEIEEQLKPIPGLYLAGNYLRGVSVGDCVREAAQMAEKIAQDLHR